MRRHKLDDEIKELLRDAWTLISRHRDDNDPKLQDWRTRFYDRMGVDPEIFSDDPDGDDIP